MIVLLLLNVLLALLSVVLLPVDALSNVVGNAIPQVMLSDFSTAVGYWISFLNVFWPLVPVWQVFIFYMTVKLTILVARLIFGARVPDAS